jgi:DNA-binding NarL/FixJ family response regulator
MAEQWAAPAFADARARGYRWQVLEASRALGIAALLAHQPGAAAEWLRAVWQHAEHQGVEDPGAFPVAPELVEALVEAGECGEAATVSARLSELSQVHAHPWGLASAKRCDAIIRLSRRKHDDQAAAQMAEAAADFGRLGLPFDQARTLLALGRALRRAKRWGAARTELQEAVAVFGRLGSPGWAAEARSELARVGARRPSPFGELTPAERRVAELAADGCSNKEIARTLHVTASTVEAHLSRAYVKLGVRSRSQLAGRVPPTAGRLPAGPAVHKQWGNPGFRRCPGARSVSRMAEYLVEFYLAHTGGRSPRPALDRTRPSRPRPRAGQRRSQH